MENLKLPDRTQFSEAIEKDTFGCVAIIYCRSTRRIVLQNRLCRNGNITFALPGGKKNKDEKAYGCVVREIKEETGLDIIDIFPFLYRFEFANEIQQEGKPDRRHLVIQYFLAIVNNEQDLESVIPDGKEFNPKWYSFTDLQTIADSFLLYNARSMKEVFRCIGFNIHLKMREA